MRKKLTAFLLCIGIITGSMFPIYANDLEETAPIAQTSIADTDGFLIPVEQKTEVPEGYIGIYTAEDLDNVRNDLEANYILMNDIDLSAYENWVPIGDITHESTFDGDKFFRGIFDGNGYTILNLVIDITNETADFNRIGLFSQVSSAFIQNLSMQDCHITVETSKDVGYVGLISGSLDNSEIENCVASGEIEITYEEKNDTVSSSVSMIGGVSGYVIRSSVQNIISNVNINANFKNALADVGGVFGRLRDLHGDFIINNLHSMGNIIIFENENGFGSCGGVIGCLEFYNTTSTVANIANSGDIQYTGGNAHHNQMDVGGIFGKMSACYSAIVNVSNLINSANIHSESEQCGGIIGSFQNPTGTGESFETSISYIDFTHVYNNGVLNCSISRDSSQYRIGGLFGAIFYSETESNDGDYSFVDIIISDSYNSGDIHATVESGNFVPYISGIIGMGSTFNYENNENCYNHLQLANIYNIGNICVLQNENEDRTNIHDIIGLLPYFLSDEIGITSCYYPSNSATNCIVSGCTPLSDSEMQSASSFVGFDFDTVWEIGVTEGYPYPTLRENPHVTSDKPTIPSDAVFYNGSYYKIFSITTAAVGSSAWAEANKICSDLGGHLAVIGDQAENDFLTSYLKSSDCSNAYFGYTDEQIEGTWVWVDCEEFSTYVNWAEGEPSSESEDYAMFYFVGGNRFSDGQWNNGHFGTITLSDDRNFICEWNVNGAERKPTVSGLQDYYTIALGDTFNLTGVLTAAGDGKLNIVNLKHNEVGTTFEPRRIELNYTTNTFNLADFGALTTDEYPLNTLGVHEFIIYASADNYTVTSNAITSFAIQVVEPTAEGSSSVICNDPVEYAGNYRSFTVTFDTKPTSAYLQFDNQNDPSKWLDDAYCAGNALFCINPNDIVEKDGRFVYETEFRIHSEGLARENYMRKVRVVADYAGKKVLSKAQSFQVNPIPVRDDGNTIGNEYQQISTPDTNVDKPVIKNVANLSDEDGKRILSVLSYDCDAVASPFFWWKSDCGTFYKISDDFRKVGFIPNGSGTVTVFMGDGLGYVASYELTIK